MSNEISADLEGFGPKMSALTEKQRRYVLAMLSDPLGNPTRWARAAGYSDVKEGAKVRGHFLAHDERISEAAQEEAARHLTTIGPVLGIGVMFQIARTKGHRDQLRAAEALANRAGFHEKTEHLVHVHKTDRTGAAMVDRIKQLADALGVDAEKLLGANSPEVAALPKVIEGEVVETGGGS
ncbi:MAG: hypothetical protein IT562_10800 [Alphaproteobacteria bacterium]|nr:hypothetical protein [Alphaproteobacteria bacterium]